MNAFFRTISNETLKNLIEAKVPLFLIDVRPEEEFQKGHIPNSQNIPIETFENDIKKLNLKFDSLIILYCTSGQSSLIAYNILKNRGFKRIYNFGKLANWSYGLEY
ncbi:rhodanese-related sulfurtransferase [Clostridium algifaecis]|uniref:Rhodanese-related sulfurtransferase n=1 Tax=Clostridium algifaecis TaxID=1472040 RepID=A0ABS4KPS3_9CLOT|nr:rhodanese-like domain-containing protein [Clostridium algifaecis]MBP2032043.1 rhodanese-related sulfurtransferase [Clostridium algifaecis]